MDVPRICHLVISLAHGGLERLVVTGGVAANSRLRAAATVAAQRRGYDLVLPERRYCTDNAAMIARAAWLNREAGVRLLPLEAFAGGRLDRVYC